MRTLVRGIVLALGVACASTPPHPYTIESGHAGAPGVDTVLMFPLNVTAPLPREVEEPAPRVEAMIAEYLLSTGREIALVETLDAQAAWDSAQRRAEAETGVSDVSTAVAQLARTLGETRDFDVLVVPNLLMRDARIYEGSRYAQWDGVRRAIRMTEEATDHGGFNLMTMISGGIPAVSLHVTAQDAGGARVFNSVAGIDLVHDFALVSSGNELRDLHASVSLRRERLTDAAAIRDGIRLAFEPYLLPEVPTAE